MQVFVPYPEPIAVARCLDSRRLRKQIIECDQILKAVRGETTSWAKHPVTKMYAKYTDWLYYYRETLAAYVDGRSAAAVYSSRYAMSNLRPPFLTVEFCDQHKRRLYAKSPSLYPQFASYGASEENWYVIDGVIVKYIKGKQI